MCQHLYLQDRATSTSRCPNCGRGPHAKSACPANGRKCNGCKGRGHFAAFCPKKKKSPPGSDKKIGQLKLRQAASPATLQATLDVSTRLNTESASTVLAWVPHTGSDVDAIGLNQLNQLGGFPENLSVDEDIFTGANGQQLGSLGKIDTTLQLDETTHDTTVHAYEELTDALLSRRTLMALGVLPSDWSHVTHVRRLASPPVPPRPRTSTKSGILLRRLHHPWTLTKSGSSCWWNFLTCSTPHR